MYITFYKFRLRSQTPGPGTYVTTKSTLGGPGYSVGHKWSEVKRDRSIPGPGTYKYYQEAGCERGRTEH